MDKSFLRYKAVDLAMLAVILAVFEALASVAAKNWFPLQLFSLSPTLAVVSIVMMRWGGWAAIHAVVGGLSYCIATGGDTKQFAVYCIGNCGALLALFLFKIFSKEKVRGTWLKSAVFAVVAFCGAMIGRWVISLFFGGESIITYFATDCLTLVFTIVVVLIARRADGLFEDQRAYLIRTEDERKRREDSELM